MKWSARIVVGLGAAALLVPALPAQAGVQHDRVVATTPVDWTPIVEDGGGVFGTATVGSTTVIGGSFTRVRARSGAVYTRNNIAAFSSTGAVSTSFVPAISTRVWDVIPAGDGQSVFVGGQFNDVGGVARTNRIARINVNTGQVMTSFQSPGFDGKVMDLHLANGRLYAGGYFSTVGGVPRTGLVALDPTTGADTGHVDITFADVFRDSTTASIPSGNSGVGVERFAMTPDGSRLIAIGNFRTVGGQSRVQVAMLDTSTAAATVSDWSTTRYSMTCHQNFPTYTMGIDTSPDGKYFVIGTGGAFNGGATSGTLCDTVARWEVERTGPGQQPTWVDYMGGDTTTAVGITGAAVYVGGHFRWANNPYAADRVGPGTVKRAGMAALDPRNGLPLSFNAGKLPLNWGVMRFESTAQGLWVAHDGDTLGGQAAGRIGLMPVAGGKVMPADNTGALPGNAYVVGRRNVPTGPSPVVHRVNAGGPTIPAFDGYADWAGDQASTSPYRNSGSNASTWTQAYTRTTAVPADTPTEIFSSERWDPSSEPSLQWNFPVEAGVPLQVRLYFANGYSGTGQVGQRVFDVNLEGTTVLDNFDIVADTGASSRGTMKAYTITSDGNVDIDLSHVVENPLINGIEIIRTDIAPEPDNSTDDVFRHPLTETAAAVPTQVGNGGVDWSSARGTFMVDGRLYTGWADGTFTWRPFNGTTFGTARSINLYGLTAFSSELAGIRGMWFDKVTGRMYFTIRGQNQLYYRYFTPESNVVGAVRFTAPNTGSGIDWSTVAGGFLANGKLYYSSTDGALRSVQWQDGAVPGTTTSVSGPGIDGLNWGNGSLFLQAQ